LSCWENGFSPVSFVVSGGIPLFSVMLQGQGKLAPEP